MTGSVKPPLVSRLIWAAFSGDELELAAEVVSRMRNLEASCGRIDPSNRRLDNEPARDPRRTCHFPGRHHLIALPAGQELDRLIGRTWT